MASTAAMIEFKILEKQSFFFLPRAIQHPIQKEQERMSGDESGRGTGISTGSSSTD